MGATRSRKAECFEMYYRIKYNNTALMEAMLLHKYISF